MLAFGLTEGVIVQTISERYRSIVKECDFLLFVMMILQRENGCLYIFELLVRTIDLTLALSL